jgi:hypothetical protein
MKLIQARCFTAGYIQIKYRELLPRRVEKEERV